MKLKAIAIALGVASAVSFANADVNSQLSSLQAQVNQLQSQVGSMGNSGSMAGVVGLNSNLSMQMMSNVSGVGKELNLLQARQNGLNQMLTLGGYMQADAVYDNSSPHGSFINPVINNASGSGSTATSGTNIELTDASLAATAEMGSWVTGYVQFGQSVLGSSISPGFKVQDAYLVLGNLSQLPVFGFVGNKDIDFGSFATVNMYNQPLSRTLFQAQGNTMGVGVNAYGFSGVASLVNGGAESTTATAIGSAYQYSNLSTSNSGGVSNGAVNLSYGMTNGPVTWNLGAGYLAGSSFKQQTQSKTNGAWDVNGKVSVMGFDLLGEYDTTANKTNLTGNQRAQAWDVGADYNFPVMGYKSVVNADYSGASLTNTTAGKGSQYVFGYRVSPLNNVWVGLEYAYTSGMANFFGDSGNAASLPSTIYTNRGSTNLGNVDNSTLALDLTAAF